jgi:hypothetical protein
VERAIWCTYFVKIKKIMNKLNTLLDQLEAKVAYFDVENLPVSQGKIGWHIEHSLLVISGITKTLAKSNPSDYKWKFSFVKAIVMITKKFPRGRAKAPQTTQPKSEVTAENLSVHIAKTRERIKELNTMNSDVFFTHPFFGDLKLRQAIRFLEIHTNHHLKIINDIVG